MSKTLEDLQKNIDELTEKLNKALAFGSLSDAEKAYRVSLPESERDAWVAKSRGARTDDVVKAAASDEVVYKADDGIEYRKSDDPRLVAAAKRNDELAKSVAAEKAMREMVELEKRADGEISHLTGTVKVRAAMLKAIDGIEDEDTRKAALESLKGASDSVARMFETTGSNPRSNGDDPINKLNALAQKRADETGEAYGVAYNKVLDTQEGRDLYTQTRN